MKGLKIVLFYFITLLFIIACIKDEDSEVQYVQADTQDESTIQTENRNGTFTNVFSLNAYTMYHQVNPTQEAFNKDTIVNTTFNYKGEKTKALTLHTGTKIAAKLYRVEILYKDSTNKVFDAWVKDTVDNFVHTPAGINYAKGDFKSVMYVRTSTQMPYYDNKYNKLKQKHRYNIRAGNFVYSDFINGTTENGKIFWLEL